MEIVQFLASVILGSIVGIIIASQLVRFQNKRKYHWLGAAHEDFIHRWLRNIKERKAK